MFQIRLITTPDELEQIQRLRAEVYGNENLEDTTKFVDGRYIDANDAWSFHIGAFTSDDAGHTELIGAIKVTPRLPGRPLKLETDVPRHMLGSRRRLSFLGLRFHAPCVELARLVVRPGSRGTGVLYGLWQEAYWVTRDQGYEHIFALQREESLRPLERAGLPVHRLASDTIVGQHGLELMPTVIVVSEVLPTLQAKNPTLAEFFARRLPGGLFDPRLTLRRRAPKASTPSTPPSAPTSATPPVAEVAPATMAISASSTPITP